MSNTQNYNRAIRAVTLQKVANDEICSYGQASTGVIKRLMDLHDSFNSQEIELFVELCAKLLPPDESDQFIQEQIDLIRGK